MVKSSNRDCYTITTQNHSTFYCTAKTAARINEAMLHVAIGRFIGMASSGKIFAGIDATGFETRHATHTILTDAISGMHLQKCQQDLI